MHRKLVHPNLTELRNGKNSGKNHVPAAESRPRRKADSRSPHAGRGRSAPPVVTSAEEFYYLKQMNNETPLVVVLNDDTRLRGRIEWYDRGCIKFIQESGPNLLLFKSSIRYFYKQEEE